MYEFKQLQLPIHLAFIMTINEALNKGKSLQVCGLNLKSECFSHGQLHVTWIRVGKLSDLYIYVKNRQTQNFHSLALQ